MPIKFKCPSCQIGLEAADVLAGKKRPCPMCGHEVSVPKTNSEIQNEQQESKEKE
jgi:hypothetical protein